MQPRRPASRSRCSSRCASGGASRWERQVRRFNPVDAAHIARVTPMRALGVARWLSVTSMALVAQAAVAQSIVAQAAVTQGQVDVLCGVAMLWCESLADAFHAET